MKAEYTSKFVRATVGLGLLGLLAGCSNGPSWGAWSKRPSDAQVAAVLARTDGTQMQAQEVNPREVPATFVAANER
jgi:hypothetical protein